MTGQVLAPLTVITSLAYFFRWEGVHPPFEKPQEIVLTSPWTGTSCPWSPVGVTTVEALWPSSRYSFKKSFFTKSSNWCPCVKQLCTLCPKALWNSPKVLLLGPKFLSLFGVNFSLSTTFGITINSLRLILNLCRQGRSPFALALVRCFFDS